MAREFCIQSTLTKDGVPLVMDVGLAFDPVERVERNFLVLNKKAASVQTSQRFRVDSRGRIVNVGLDDATEEDGYLTLDSNGSGASLVCLDALAEDGDAVVTPLQLWTFENAEEYSFIVLDQGRLYLTATDDHTEIAPFTVLARPFPPLRDGQLWLFEEVPPAVTS